MDSTGLALPQFSCCRHGWFSAPVLGASDVERGAQAGTCGAHGGLVAVNYTTALLSCFVGGYQVTVCSKFVV